MERSGNFYKAIRLGYILISILIGCMAYNSLYEWQEIEALELGNKKIDELRKEINNINIQMIKFSLLGETILEWNDKDIEHYHARRMAMDSMLCRFKATYPAERIDSVRSLLEDKERQMFQIVRLMDEQQSINKKIANQIPVIVQKSVQEQSKKPKRKGFLGIFGKKNVQVLPSAKELHEFSDSLITLQRKQAAEMDAYADSLRTRNLTLNAQMNRLVSDLDRQAQAAFQQREQKIAEAQSLSMRLYTATISAAIILLFLSYLTIHRELKRNANEKKKREKLIGELQVSDNKNKELIRLRRNLIQNVSHELRTPLTAIIGNAELVLQGKEDAERVHHTEAIRESAGRMAFMINNLLEYFRLDNGKVTINPRPFKLNTIAETLEMEFTPLAEAKKLTLNVNSHAVEVVTGDKNRILNIGSNLLSNAIKFTPKGTVVLTTTYRNGQFSLVVEDTGTGISEEKRDEIFKPFERLGNAVTQDGFGLGLSIVKQLVGLMKGSILLESVQGKGSRFTVTLPLPEAEQVADGTERIERRSVPDCSIILLDNDRVILDMMRGMLVQNGANCDACLTVGELTDKMRDKDYDLLITDLKMPEMNGYEVLELLRTSEIGNSRTIPVVAATAAGYITQEELVSQGFTAMLPKPFSIGELLDIIGMCVRKNPRRRPDLSPLLAFGDGKRTLERLASETEKEMDEVLKAAEAKDMEALDGWVHHLRSSWMLMKAEQPLMVLYEAIHKENISESEVNAAVSEVLAQGRLIMELARKEAAQWEE